MDPKPLVLVDVDGVLGDFHTPAFEIANRLFKTDHQVQNCSEWDIAKYMKLTPKQEHLFYEHIKRPGFHERIKPYPFAQVGIATLREVAEVHFLTSPMFATTWCYERWNWLEHFFDAKGKDVTHTHRKEQFAGEHDRR